MRVPAILLLALIALTACQGPSTTDGSPTAQPTESAGSPSAPASEPPSSDSPSSEPPSSATPEPGTEEPVPSDELGAFTCELPIVEDPTVPIANIVDVRIGVHDGYDRVVFEFEQGTPELSLSRAEPPFVSDGSGLPVEVDGTHFIALLMRGGTVQTDEGTSSYDGPREFSDEAPALVHLVEGGDFERQSTWYLGLAEESCVRVLLLDEPHRLVIDIEHP